MRPLFHAPGPSHSTSLTSASLTKGISAASMLLCPWVCRGSEVVYDALHLWARDGQETHTWNPDLHQ